MAVNYVWPGGLPQRVQRNYSEAGGALIMRTPMDAGPAKMRRRGMRPQTLSVTLDMTSGQVELLEEFVQGTLSGTSRFGFPHPRLGVQAEVRLVPSGDGELYKIVESSPGWWEVSMSLEVMP